MNQEPSDWEKRGVQLRTMSLAVAIPSMFIGGPLGVGFVGYFIGRYFWETPNTGFLVGFVLGVIIAIRETSRILKRISKANKK